MEGGAGNDVLIDGTGSDRLDGGAGADVFIFVPDGQNDTISAFDITEDRIDLSAYGALYDISALSIRNLSNGVRLDFLDESLIIETVNNAPLNAYELREVILFDANHVDIPVPTASSSGAESNRFLAGAHADTVDGGSGYDFISFESLATGVTVDLSGTNPHGGGPRAMSSAISKA